MVSPTIFRSLVEEKLRLTSEEVRKSILDIRPHFLPIGVDILQRTIEPFLARNSDSVKVLNKHLIERANILGFKSLSIDHAGIIRVANTSTVIEGANIKLFTPALVYDTTSPDSPIGILAASPTDATSAYSKLSTGIFEDVRKSIIVKASGYGNSNYKPGVDIGHTITSRDGNTGSRAGTTPVQYQADIFRDTLEQELSSNTNPRNRANIISVMNRLDNAQRIFLNQTHKEYGGIVEIFLSKSFTQGLISVNANIVLIQDRYENQYVFASKEKKFLAAIRELILKINFSRSAKEEVVHRIVSEIKGAKVVDSKASIKLPTIKFKIPSPKITTGKPPPVTRFNNAARNLSTGRFTSVTNLRNLLNFHLHDVVAANMGKGEPPSRILNFQTGRFATSTEVERVSVTRQGEVQAFYNYMKYPYATFSEGGAQQFPRTRDPKLLISKSIREIAQTMGINRMRAILV